MRAIRRLFGRRDEAIAPAVRAGREVTLWIRGLGRTGGTVTAAGERDAEIALAVDPRFGDHTITEEDAVVEHTAERGLYRQAGSVRFISDAGVSFAASAPPELVQRRDFVRLHVDLSVRATLAGEETKLELPVIDLSASGVLIGRSADAKLGEGATVWLSIPIGDGLPPISPRGTVVRGAEAGTHGVRFDYITDSDQERLARFVLQEQLRLRREGKL